MKEVRLAPNIGTHDLAFKQRHAINFLKEGASVKITLQFKRGRDFYVYQDKAKACINQFIKTLEEYGGYLKKPVKLLGRRMSAIVAPEKTTRQSNKNA